MINIHAVTPRSPTHRLKTQLFWRYWRVLGFFFRAFASLFIFDLLLDRPVLRLLRPAPIPRWQRLARRFRDLALRWGGVLIKLGQYLSTRVDILPSAVTKELAGLQDEVPAETFDAIRAQIESEFGRALNVVFPTFMEHPLGAASFAQVHEAQLPTGRPVVVKVLRPGLEALVETDLKALKQALGWLKLWPAVKRRVDLDWLEEEFAATTRRELDLEAEGRHVERFAENFRNDPGVHAPAIFWSATTRRVLTEENVAYIKITDRERLRAAGIDPKEVAARLYRLYMEQIFVHNFVHSDPHPGNLFVRPVARTASFAAEWATQAAERAASAFAGGPVERSAGAPFQIIFVDFGMMAEIPPRLRAALRKFLIGLSNRDAAQVIQSLRDAGTLLPGADLANLEEALDAIFDRFWGLDLSHLNRLVMSEASALWREFGALLRDTPIQVQVDLMFTLRGLELLSGITSELDKEFNPWTEAVPFAQMLASESIGDIRGRVFELFGQLRSLASLPGELGRTIGLAQRGRLTMRAALAPDTRRQLQRLESRLETLSTSVLAGACLVAGALLLPSEEIVGYGFFSAAALLALFSRLFRR